MKAAMNRNRLLRVLAGATLCTLALGALRSSGQGSGNPIRVAAVPQPPTLLGMAHGDTVLIVGGHVRQLGWRSAAQAKGLFGAAQTMKVYNWQRQIGTTTVGVGRSTEVGTNSSSRPQISSTTCRFVRSLCPPMA